MRVHLNDLNMRHLHGGARVARARRLEKAALVDGVVLSLDVAVYDAAVEASPLPPGVDAVRYVVDLATRLDAAAAVKRARAPRDAP